jgi:antitoxin FitA
MASITIRKLDDSLKARLRVRAAHNGRSMEEEAREILRAGLTTKQAPRLNLVESIRRRFVPLGGVDLTLPVREPVRKPPKLTE